MLPKYQTSFIAAAVCTSLLAGCDGSDNNNTTNGVTDTTTPYESMLTALGGEQAITSAAQLSFNVAGTAYEFQEQPEPVANLMARFSYDVVAALDGSQLRQEWQIDAVGVIEVEMSFTEVIDGSQGVVIGGPNSFSAYALGPFGVPTEPMNSAKLATRQKTWFMSSPLAIAGAIIEQKNDGANVIDNEASRANNTLIAEFRGQEVSLLLDEETHLPKSAQTLEFDPLLGDVVYQVEYANWQPSGSSFYPMNITHTLDGNLIREETLSGVQMAELTADNFDFTDITPSTRDTEAEHSGYISSQFYLRGMMMGFPFDGIDETQVHSNFIDSENKVLRVMGTGHYSYAFLIDDRVYIFDASLNNARQQVVLTEVQAQFPGKEIAGVILSHNHYDHSGGWRGALAQGGDLLVGAGSEEFYQQLLTKPHTLQPNPLAQREAVQVIPVDGKLILGEGTETLEIYSVAQEGHAEEDDMLILYRPDDKTLIYADLYSSGANMLQTLYPEVASTYKKRAQLLIDFVELHNLDVVTIAPTHAIDNNDTSYDSVKAAAAF
ncbi:MBL fold metallo-hydrolase [Thalassomonas sp. RHCl1]|uniref:MBL fold metallo-hydrolase n=1 Tax=Thalassomonas sp. RHCl1 TaxID=2995320 RepID=UPI00248B8AE5|nr:MBL fold metallo-hydrolase [Thalassomonas sp. RHCl1]